MTVSTVTNNVVYRGNGATTAFAVPFKVLDDDHLVVQRRVYATGETEHTYIGTEYEYSGLGDSSGTLTLDGPALDDDYELVIERIVPYTQELDIVNAGGFYPDTVEEQLDLTVMGLQQLKEITDRALLVPVGEDGATIAPAHLRTGGTILGFNYDTGAFEVQDGDDFIGTPGVPGGNELALGLKVDLEGVPIPAHIHRVLTSGYGSVGVGPAWYWDIVPTFDLVTWPEAGFTSADGRVWVLDGLNQPLNAYMFGATGVGDDGPNLQRFYDYLAFNSVRRADLQGVFSTGQTLYIGRSSGNSSTRNFIGSLNLTALAAMDVLLEIRNVPLSVWSGMRFFFFGTGATGSGSFASRTVGVGLRIRECQRSVFTGFWSFDSFWCAGVTVGHSNNSGVELPNIKSIRCGSGTTVTSNAYTLTGSWSNPVDNGSVGSASQSTTIDVTSLPPTNVASILTAGGTIGDVPIQVRINGYLHFVTSINFGTSQINVYPWLPASPTSGSFEWVIGGAVCLMGNDTNVISIRMVEALQCGRGLMAGSLYAPNVERIITQQVGTVLLIGRQPGGACLGGNFRGVYCENSDEDVVVLSRFGGNNYHTISSEYAMSLSRCWATGNARQASGKIENGSFNKIVLILGGDIYQHASSGEFLVRQVDGNSSTINLDAGGPSAAVRLFGLNSVHYICTGTGAANEPTGTITFAANGTGTVNGGASQTYSALTAPLQVLVTCTDMYADTWTVTKIAG